jgi:predicted aconitase
MQLTDEEKKMLNGDEGEDVRKSMEILVGMGEAFDAKRFIGCDGAHVYTPGLYSYYFRSVSEAKAKLEDVISNKVKVKCLTTCCAACPDFEISPEVEGFDPDFIARIKVCMEIYKQMNIVLTIACAPYLVGILPQRGEHVDYTESSDWVFANSIQGAHSNRGGMSALYSALTGRIPEFGMHLTQNRRGNKIFQIEAGINNKTDIGALFFHIGHLCDEAWSVPVLNGLKFRLSIEDIKQACGAISASGAAAMFHIVGVTPEAASLEIACQGNVTPEKVAVTDADLKKAYETLCTAKTTSVDMVLFGCPHASIKELGEIAILLESKRIRQGVRLWVQCLPETRMMAEKLGYVQTIEQSGGLLLRNACIVMYEDERITTSSIPKEVKVLATNSAKTAYYAPAEYNWGVWYGSAEQCVEAAITGKWGG